MTNPLTRDERERMRELESKATDAPWERYSRTRIYKLGDASERVVATKPWSRIGEDHELTVTDAQNFDFIAAARTFIPRALADLDAKDALLREALVMLKHDPANPQLLSSRIRAMLEGGE